MLTSIPMETITNWASAQITAMSGLVKDFFVAIVIAFFGYRVVRAKFAMSAIVVGILACALFVWVVKLDGLNTIANMMKSQAG